VQFLGNYKVDPFRALVLGLAVLLAVACGTAAPETPQATNTPGPPGATTAVSTPAGTPARTPTPASVAPTGKVTVMMADWGTQAFEPRDAIGQVITYHRFLHGWLIAGTKEVQMIPGIAKKWEVSPDGLRWTWTIRKGVKFYNGDELTIEDVHFTLNRHHGTDAAEKALHPTFVTQARDSVSQEITGPDTIVVTQKAPNVTYPFLMSELHSSDSHGAVLPKIYWEQVGGKEGWERNPVGAGPLKLVEFKRSEQMLFERFEDYYFTPQNGFPEDRRMKFQTLDFRLVPEQATRVSALVAGQADMIEASLQVRKQVEDAGGRLIFIPEASYSQVRPAGCWKPEFPCHDKRVRHALDYAINKELIRDTLYGGPEVAQVNGMEHVTPHALGYSKELDAFPYDPQKAKQLLAEAGYPDGKGYPPFKIYTWSGGDVPLQPEQAQLIADMWRKNLGLQVEVEVGDPVGVRNRFANRELDGHIQFRSNEARYDGGTSLRNTFDPSNTFRQGEDPELLRVGLEALAVMDPAKRHEAYNKAYKIHWEAHYYWSTVYVNLPWGVSKRIATWEPWPLGPYASAPWTVTLK
jgi:peptide/nickel transport system substrate-binding protein